ncbi:hypothetical protein Sked_28760 [Sanguibacter keddieii DSM 10542]|uniref:DUF2637 domain-containing protein n=1 Tax=Sanguibacter keddieii (strain ATCC 51767 / DSM 10542 / NCFB 3025 / ST-74) TaxID=446469 RepID=D1BBK7_SANKS|nr:hypothetical protein [Sanguibacter keddieii]ACZ22778.1 hypothetical protein Sked_28760 [Sanguibacter keddieii DSM 10542]
MAQVVVALVIALGVSALLAGVPAILAAGAAAGLHPWLRPLLAVAIDGALIVYSLVIVVRRSRSESARLPWAATVLLVAGSATIQVVHALDVAGSVSPMRVAGAAVVGVLPLLVALNSHFLTDLLVEAPKPVRKGRTKPASKPAPAPVAARKRPVSRESDVAAPAPLRAVRTPAEGVPVAAEGDREARRERVLELRAAGRSFSQISVETGIPASTAKRLAAAA